MVTIGYVLPGIILEGPCMAIHNPHGRCLCKRNPFIPNVIYSGHRPASLPNSDRSVLRHNSIFVQQRPVFAFLFTWTMQLYPLTLHAISNILYCFNLVSDFSSNLVKLKVFPIRRSSMITGCASVTLCYPRINLRCSALS